MIDQTKMNITREAFNKKLDSVDSWADFKTMIAGITKAKVKNFLKSNIEEKAQEIKDKAIQETGSAGTGGIAKEVDDLATEVDNI